ncbi:hypothetical protein I79_018741 [Cricetulus griseus]|uniref:Uncharacterized protein n=1 Tax=Cricetulus griseus TaxID=10029 RepID=G3I5J2_CRIGR|nr:hypothetical protein I79_018741 [Cricetulus griseus]
MVCVQSTNGAELVIQIKLPFYDQLIFDTAPRIHSREQIISAASSVGKTRYPHENNEIGSLCYTFMKIKISSKA